MSGQCKHCGHDGCVCTDEERTNAMNTLTPRTDEFEALRNAMSTRASADYVSALQLCDELERELTAVTEQRDKLIKAIEPLEYWRDISECDYSCPLPQGGCLRCDLNRILKITKPNA